MCFSLAPVLQVDRSLRFGCGSKPMGSHFGVGALPILEPMLVGIGMFTEVRDFDPWSFGVS